MKPSPVPELSSKNSKDSKGMPFWPKPEGASLKDLKADLGFGGGVGGRMSFQWNIIPNSYDPFMTFI